MNDYRPERTTMSSLKSLRPNPGYITTSSRAQRLAYRVWLVSISLRSQAA